MKALCQLGRAAWATLPIVFQIACSSSGSLDGASSGSSNSAATSTFEPVPSSTALPVERPRFKSSAERQGQSIVRAAAGNFLIVAQQDLNVLHLISLPIDPSVAPREVPLSGRPAQIAVVGNRVLVTVRDPGKLVTFEISPDKNLVEKGQVDLPADAFGMVVSPDEKNVLVTSAWSHAVTSVDVSSLKVNWTVDVAREPRGIDITPDGSRAYVTHLVGVNLTRIDHLRMNPVVSQVHLKAGPLRARGGVAEAASLAYTGVLSPDGSRLFVARQSLTADGKRPWNGQPVVDVLLTGEDTNLATPATKSVSYTSPELEEAISTGTGRGSFRDLTFGGGFPRHVDPFIAARAVVYRTSTRSLLVASEGTDALVELDALAVDPAAHVLRRHHLRGRPWSPKAGRQRAMVLRRHDGVLFEVELEDGRSVIAYDEKNSLNSASSGMLVGLESRKKGSAEFVVVEREPDDSPGATACGAPSGVALSENETKAWVLCRSTFGVVEVVLDPNEETARNQRNRPNVYSLAKDPLPADAAMGRRLFYNAWDGHLSGGYSCNSCHPDGRDDGHVWHELLDEQSEDWHKKNPNTEECGQYLSAPVLPFFIDMYFEPKLWRGYPRQTPMLAGRLNTKGPFGWKGKSPDLTSRVIRGSAIHGWLLPEYGCGFYQGPTRAKAIAAFAKTGLVRPPKTERLLSQLEERGKVVFNDSKTGCATCHVPATDYTDRSVVPFAAPPPLFDASGPVVFFSDEKDRMFKTPSLLFVGGTAPYFHDGTAATLEEVIEKNRDRMGKTSHLSAEDKAALVAFLKTL
ncbi:MAG: hypothetical protein IPK82_19435 [Polyangiaceae bacterium]|nr:hypothetical protein [Polyangiaceae bacterium]